MASWVFRQQGGDRKTLTLDGYAAPFGRPRRDPVVKELIKVNIQTTRYPGSSNPPTRHSFGSGWEPMELKGRWMTKTLTDGRTANDVASTWTAFVRDEQEVRVSWGNIASWSGMIEELELARESEHEIAWRMSLLVDVRDGDLRESTPTPQMNVEGTTKDVFDFAHAKDRAVSRLLDLPEMETDFFEFLEFSIGALKSATGLLLDISGSLTEIEKATFSTIANARGIVGNIELALVELRALVMNTQIDAILVVRRSESDLEWWRAQLDFDVDSLRITAQLREFDRQLAIQASSSEGSNTRFITAIEGDDWEKLSTRATGSPENASAIRAANDIHYGELPVAGQQYIVLQAKG